jgi:hypothetical protein
MTAKRPALAGVLLAYGITTLLGRLARPRPR